MVAQTGRPNPTRAIAAHLILVAVVSSIAIGVLYARAYRGRGSSDGVNYWQVARNVAEGRGLVTSVIQPGLIEIVPTTNAGQAFIVQQPLWPWLLGQWFRGFGASETALVSLVALLYTATLLLTWGLAFRAAQSVSWAYIGTAMAAFNLHLLGSAFGGVTVPLQGFLVTGVVLALSFERTRTIVVVVAVLVALGILTRETSVFLLPAVGLAWLLADRQERAGQSVASGTVLWALVFVAACGAGGYFLEAHRKAELLGRWDSPVLRLTFLYNTPLDVDGWPLIFRSPAVGIDAIGYLWRHPDVLLHKMQFQISAAFVPDVLRGLLSTNKGLVPLLLPWLIPSAGGRRCGWALLSVVALQTLFASMAFLHFTYYLAFVPALCALVAATASGLVSRARDRVASSLVPGIAPGIIMALAALYAVLPLATELNHLRLGREVPQGDYHLSHDQEAALTFFLARYTPRDAVVASAFSPLMTWNSGRPIMQYTANPRYRIGPTESWRSIQAAVPIDFVLLSSLAGEDPRETPMLDGFAPLAELRRADVSAWLFKRVGAPERPEVSVSWSTDPLPEETPTAFRKRLLGLARWAEIPAGPAAALIEPLVVGLQGSKAGESAR